MKIGVVSQQTGVPVSTLRYYEQIGLIPPPRRVNGRRDYDSEIFSHLAFIERAQAAGFRLQEILALLRESPPDNTLSERWHVLARQKLDEIRAEIQRLEQAQQTLNAGLTCSCTQLSNCALVQH